MKGDFFQTGGWSAQLNARIAEVEVEFAIRPKNKSMNAVVMIETGNAREKQFALIGHSISIRIGEHEHVG